MAKSAECSVKEESNIMNYLYQINIVTFVLAICQLMAQIQGHGMMLSPVGRSSRWRYDSKAPTNYDDNGLYCGGFWKQTVNDGKCGLCGDDYSLPQPRPNEHGGKYGLGVIVASYVGVTSMDISVHISANHLGYFSYDLCNMDEFGQESEECFAKGRLQFIDGNDKLYIGTTMNRINQTISIPSNLNCKHCVLRWTYTAGNNWGYCENGVGALGCGDQEHFVNCADVSIWSDERKLIEGSRQAELPVAVPED